MADSIETIKASMTAPTHEMINGVEVELSESEANDILNSWAEAERDRQLDEEANGYKRERQAEYPPLEEQLDYIYHNGIEAWKTDIIQPIKESHPKP